MKNNKDYKKMQSSMSYTYCTLFDSNYLDKGLLTIKSLLKYSKATAVYVLAMDTICFDVLNKLGLDRVVIISLDEFEDHSYRLAKSNRSRAEYCYTCTAGLIAFIFDRFHEEIVTYIDADLYFYSNPDVLVQEMVDSGSSVLITRHGFSNSFRYRIIEQKSGTYCVEFNSFKNDPSGNEVLREWQKQTLESCSYENGNFGDQFYLQDWPEKYTCIHVLQNLGAGVAPWNMNRYKLRGFDQEGDILLTVDGRINCQLVFYHFESIKYLTKETAQINLHAYHWFTDRRLAMRLYSDYLKEAKKEKEMLEANFGIYPIIFCHPASAAIDKASKVAARVSLRNLSLNDFLIKAYLHVDEKLRNKLLLKQDTITIE